MLKAKAVLLDESSPIEAPRQAWVECRNSITHKKSILIVREDDLDFETIPITYRLYTFVKNLSSPPYLVISKD